MRRQLRANQQKFKKHETRPMNCTIENTSPSETGIIHFSGGSIVKSFRIPPARTSQVEYTPGDMLAYTGKRLLLRPEHNGKTLQWPTSFTD